MEDVFTSKIDGLAQESSKINEDKNFARCRDKQHSSYNLVPKARYTLWETSGAHRYHGTGESVSAHAYFKSWCIYIDNESEIRWSFELSGQ